MNTETKQVEGCNGDPPEFLCASLRESGLCDATFGGFRVCRALTLTPTRYNPNPTPTSLTPTPTP